MSAAAPVLGSPRLHLRRTDSTNERARALAAAGAPHGALVTAAEQSAGRGRQGRSWSAPAGSALLMTLILAPAPRMLPLAAAVAVCDAVDEAPGAERRGAASIKWPNDVVLERPPGLAKLAGILIEARPQQGWAVLGIGFNAAVDLEDLPVELRPTAATLGLSPSELEPLLDSLLASLSRRLGEPPQQTLAAWAKRDALRGRRIEWSTPVAPAPAGPVGASTRSPGGSGVAQGIDGDGRLLVALDGGGETALGSGEVHLRAPG
ncbi:MAG: BirA family transcriptional regulator [Solirubrobacteraceae bacterium]|nr:biotin--[acetyl-CoA-carboxylase] ligase [Solirubrobacterales bacterium]MEA2217119.1 BirA family transcriptional regulator [Solirubrobacteraceae bacterium]